MNQTPLQNPLNRLLSPFWFLKDQITILPKYSKYTSPKQLMLPLTIPFNVRLHPPIVNNIFRFFFSDTEWILTELGEKMQRGKRLAR